MAGFGDRRVVRRAGGLVWQDGGMEGSSCGISRLTYNVLVGERVVSWGDGWYDGWMGGLAGRRSSQSGGPTDGWVDY